LINILCGVFKKKIVEDDLCPICGREQETTLHILWACSSAIDAWSVGPRSFQKKHSMGFTKFSQLVEDVLDHCEQGDISLFVGIARRLWNRRNDVVFNGIMLHPTAIVQHSVAAMEEFAQANNSGAIATVLPQMQVSDWNAPDMSWLKMNWDASLAKDKDWMGVGMVLWDEKGFVIAAYNKTFFGRLDVLKAEAKVALMAIQVCKRLGFSKFHLEGDSQGVIAAINSREPDWSSMGVLVEDIK
jgi:hypothetical protein